MFCGNWCQFNIFEFCRNLLVPIDSQLICVCVFRVPQPNLNGSVWLLREQSPRPRSLRWLLEPVVEKQRDEEDLGDSSLYSSLLSSTARARRLFTRATRCLLALEYPQARYVSM